MISSIAIIAKEHFILIRRIATLLARLAVVTLPRIGSNLRQHLHIQVPTGEMTLRMALGAPNEGLVLAVLVPAAVSRTQLAFALFIIRLVIVIVTAGAARIGIVARIGTGIIRRGRR